MTHSATAPTAPAAYDPSSFTAGVNATCTQHFELGDEYARGGMGRIVVGTDGAFGRRVAVKLLLTDDAELRTRFEREAQITASLQHPGIVPVYAAGEHAGRPFYVMRFVGGRTLARCFADARTVEERLALLPQLLSVVETMAYAHTHGVLHRDLKPQNIMIGEFGEAVVLDWGLGKLVGDSAEPTSTPLRGSTNAELTEVGATMGTPAYMPVEQARGETVDPTADVYALGAILYELFEGRPPYAGRTTAEVVAAVLDAPPPPMSRTRGIAPELITIVTRAMAREASDRYPHAAALAEDLRRYLSGQLVGTHQYTKRELVVRWLRRHRTAATVALLGSVALAISIALSMRGLMHERDRTEAQRVLAEQRRAAGEDLIAFAIEDLAKRLDGVGRLDALEGLGTQVSAYYNATGDAVADWRAAVRRVQASSKIAMVAGHRGDYKEELAMLDAGIRIAARWRVPMVIPQMSAELRERALTVEREWIYLFADRADAHVLRNRHADARRDCEYAVAAARTLLAWPLTAEERAKAAPTLLSALFTLYGVLQNANAIAELGPVTEELVQLTESALTAQPESTVARRRVAMASYQAAVAAYNIDDLSSARAHVERGKPHDEALVRELGDISDRLRLFGFLQVEAQLVKGDERVRVIQRAIAVVDEAHRVDAQNLNTATSRLLIRCQLAEALDADGRPREARAELAGVSAQLDELARSIPDDTRYQVAATDCARVRAKLDTSM